MLVKGTFVGRPEAHAMIVDCKRIVRTLDVAHVESFAGLIDDVGAAMGSAGNHQEVLPLPPAAARKGWEAWSSTSLNSTT